jgi:hypothetical protein
MTDRVRFDLDAALAALAVDERAAQPAVSESLQARVLGDAGEVAAERAGAVAEPPRNPVPRGRFWLFGLFDVWTGAAAAAVTLCLVIGLGVGYRSGPEVLAQAGLGEMKIAVAGEEDGELFLSEDVL